jgi:HK97 family phage portal protein
MTSMLQRVWSRAPGREKSELPSLFHQSPRLDPVRVIAKTIAATPWHLYDRADLRANKDAAKPLDRHPLYDFFDSPIPSFPELDWFSLIYLTSAHYDLTGDFLWMKARLRPGGPVIGLLPIPSAWNPQKPTVGNHEFLIYPYGVTAGTALHVPPEDVVWFKDPDISDPYSSGRGSSESIADEVQTDEFASKYQKNFFFNDAQPPFALMTEDRLNEDQAKTVKQNWMQALAGWVNSHMPAVLGGKWTIQKLTDSTREMDMVESRKFLRDEAIQHWQMPPEMFGIIENSNRSTIESSFFLMGKNVSAPRLIRLESIINRQLVWTDFDAGVVFKFDNVVPEDKEFDLKVYGEGLQAGTVMVDEWRNRFGLPELPGGAGKIFLRPFSAIEVRSGEKKPELAPVPDDTVLDIEEDAAEEEPTLDIDEEKSFTKSDDARRLAVWKMFDAKARTKEAGFVRQVQKFSAVQATRMRSAIEGMAQTEKGIDAALNSVFTDKEHSAVKASLAPAWIDSMNEGNDHGLATINKSVKTSRDVLNKLFNVWIEKNGLMKAKEINETTRTTLRKNLQAILSEGTERGSSPKVMAEEMLEACNEVYDNLDKARALLIAETESCSSINFGVYATYQVEGVETKSWLAISDDRTREPHADADGQTVKINEPFIVDGEPMDYPGDPAASGKNVCRCRCTMLGGMFDALAGQEE